MNLNKKQIIDAIEKLNNAKYCFGITSDTTERDKHVVFWDFDGKHKLSDIALSLRNMQNAYNLSTIYILKSSNGFNAFCLSKRRLIECYNILRQTKNIDMLFVNLGYKKNNRYILRMDLDKKLTCILERHSNETLSNSHKWFFKYIMQFPIEDKHIYDNNFIFRIVAYKSVKYGFVELYD